jgi:hypothetical protein
MADMYVSSAKDQISMNTSQSSPPRRLPYRGLLSFLCLFPSLLLYLVVFNAVFNPYRLSITFNISIGIFYCIVALCLLLAMLATLLAASTLRIQSRDHASPIGIIGLCFGGLSTLFDLFLFYLVSVFIPH